MLLKIYSEETPLPIGLALDKGFLKMEPLEEEESITNGSGGDTQSNDESLEKPSKSFSTGTGWKVKFTLSNPKKDSNTLDLIKVGSVDEIFKYFCDEQNDDVAVSRFIEDLRKLDPPKFQHFYAKMEKDFFLRKLNPEWATCGSKNKFDFYCKICGKTVHCYVDLKFHINGHAGLKPYSCTQCERKYPSSSALCKHVDLQHRRA